jgi:hypothetical protein
MIADALSSGHILLADWLFAIGAVLFIFAAIVHYVREERPVSTDGTHRRLPPWEPVLTCLGLACVAVGLLVL